MDVSGIGTSFRRPGVAGTRLERGARVAILVCASCLPAACLHWPEVASECDAYGVAENHQPMGEIVIAEPLYRDELEVQCAAVKEPSAGSNSDDKISGCVIPQAGGIVRAYYWTGDRCALNHELCHAAHGSSHTERYLADLERGVPMPYCPENQLWSRR